MLKSLVVFVLASHLGLSLLGCSKAEASTLLIHVSDTHSAYQNIPNFLQAITQRVENFRKTNPTGQVLFVFNGDSGGNNINRYSELDYGQLDFDLIAEIGKLYPTVAVEGNHGGLDFQVTTGFEPNEIFYNQTKQLSATVPVLAASLDFNSEFGGHFKPFHDFEWAERSEALGPEKLRVVGVNVHNYFQEATYEENSPFPIYQSTVVKSYLKVMQEQFLQAQKDKVDTLIFEVHQEAAVLKPIVEQFLRWKREQKGKYVKVPVFGGAHEHKVNGFQVQDSWVVEAGCDYAFAEMLFDDNWTLKDYKHWSVADQKQFADNPVKLSPDFIFIREEAKDEVKTVTALNNKIIRPALSTVVGENLPVERKIIFGFYLAHALQHWAEDTIAEHADQVSKYGPLFFFPAYNLLSYGSDHRVAPLFSENVTLGKLKSAIYFNGRLRLFVVSGDSLQKFYRAVRSHAQANQAPFRSPLFYGNYREFTSAGRPTLAYENYDNKKGRGPIKIDPKKNYVLAVDHWLGRNGYSIPELDEIYKKALWKFVSPERSEDVLIRYFSKRDVICPGLLSNFGIKPSETKPE